MAKTYTTTFELGGQLNSTFTQAINKANRSTNELKHGLSDLQAEGKEAAGAFGKLSKVTSDFGNAVYKVAQFSGAFALVSGITDSITDAIGSIGAFQGAMRQVEASTGASKEEMAELSQMTRSLYNQNIGESFDDLASAMSLAKQVTKQQGQELQDTTKHAVVFRDVFGEDIKESVKAADTMMRNFGISSSDSFNLLAQGAQRGLDKSGELLDSANEYAPHFASLGFSANQMFDTFSAGLDSGAFNLDKVGDAVKEFNIRSKDMSASSTEAYELLGYNAEQMAQTFAKGGPQAQAAFAEIVQAISSVEDPVQKNTIGVGLFGTQFEDLEKDVIKAMGSARSQFDMTSDTMNSIADIKYDTIGMAFRGIGRQIMTGVVLPIGDKALPYLQTFSGWMTGAIPKAQVLFQAMGQAIDRVGDKLSFIGDAFNVAKSIFSGNLDFDAWTSLVEKLKGIGVSGEHALQFSQAFTRGMLRAKDAVDVVTNGAQLLFSILGGGADLDAWSGMQQALVKLGMSQEGAYQVATKFSAYYIQLRETAIKALSGIGDTMMTMITAGAAQWEAWAPAVSATLGKIIPPLLNMWSSVQTGIRKVIPLFGQVAVAAQAIAFKLASALAPVAGFLLTKVLPGLTNIVSFITGFVVPAIAGVLAAILPKVISIVGKIGEAFTAIWGFISPVMEGLVAAFNFAFPTIQSIVMNAITMIGGVIGGVLDILGGVIDFVTGVFTGNWEKAWTGVKDIFTGIFKGLGAILTFPINNAIDAINRAIGGINGLKIEIPDWVPVWGGKTFSTSISEIPKIGGYAKGGVVSRPELAWIGEGGDTEIVIPINNSARSQSLYETAGRMLGQPTGSEVDMSSLSPALGSAMKGITGSTVQPSMVLELPDMPEPTAHTGTSLLDMVQGVKTSGGRSDAAAGENDSIVVNYSPTINAPGASSDVLQQIAGMLAAERANVKKIIDEALNGRKRLSYG